MKKMIILVGVCFTMCLSAALKIQCNHPMRYYRVGETVEFRIDGQSGTELPVEIAENGDVVRRETVKLPAVVKYRSRKSGVVSCSAESGGKTITLETYHNPEEFLSKSQNLQAKSAGFQRYGNAVNEYYVKRFREIAAARAKRLAGLKTRKDAEEYVQEVRRKIRECFGLDREKRCPLNPRITAVHKFPSYRMENVIFESRPGYFVTGNLYLPEKKSATPIPAVLVLCGHTLRGKSSYSSIPGITFAANGFAALVVDPVNQGERMQYAGNFETEGVYGHNQLGKKLLPAGDWFGAWRAFDAIRSLDYLLSRPEVDSRRVYVSGCSGGGTLTTWLNALDDRLAGAAPSCYITSWQNNVENELPADAEQTPPGLAGSGLDMADFLIAAAPRPLLVLGAENDFFDPRGYHEAVEQTRKIYRLLGAELSINAFMGVGNHNYSRDQREQFYQFVKKLTGMPMTVREEQLQKPLPEQFWAAPGGQVKNIPGNITAEEAAKQRRDQIISARKKLQADQLPGIIRKLLAVSGNIPVPSYRIPRPEYVEEIKTLKNRFLLEDSRHIMGELCWFSPFLQFHLRPLKSALLYIPHWSSPLEYPVFISEMPEPFDAYFSFDPFGVGGLTPASCGHYARDFGAPYNYEYHFASLGLMLGESYLGRRVEAILGAIQLLRSAGVEQITLVGAGRSSVAAAMAALLAGKQLRQTILINPLKSYKELPLSITKWPQTEMIFGILKYTDLPEIYQAVGAQILDRPYARVE